MTPESSYDPKQAHRILFSLQSPVVDAALAGLASHGLVSKTRGGTDRRVPGRGYRLSDKFLTLLSGWFTNRLVAQAVSWYDQLNQNLYKKSSKNVSVVFSPLITSGGMACLLDQLADERIKLVPEKSLTNDTDVDIQRDHCFNLLIKPSGENVQQNESSKRAQEEVVLLPAKRTRGSPKKTPVKGKGKSKEAWTPIQQDILKLVKDAGVLGLPRAELIVHDLQHRAYFLETTGSKTNNGGSSRCRIEFTSPSTRPGTITDCTCRFLRNSLCRRRIPTTLEYTNNPSGPSGPSQPVVSCTLVVRYHWFACQFHPTSMYGDSPICDSRATWYSRGMLYSNV